MLGQCPTTRLFLVTPLINLHTNVQMNDTIYFYNNYEEMRLHCPSLIVIVVDQPLLRRIKVQKKVLKVIAYFEHYPNFDIGRSFENTSYSAMLNIREPVPHPESITTNSSHSGITSTRYPTEFLPIPTDSASI